MKKVLFSILLVIPLIFTNCKQEDEPILLEETLNIKPFTSLLNQSKETVKSTIKYKLGSETETLGKVKLTYNIETQEAKYYATIEFTLDNRVSKIHISSTETRSYSEGINLTKKLSDRINAYGGWAFYSGFYTSGSLFPSTNNRNTYWNYLAENGTKDNPHEVYGIKNGVSENNKLIYEDVEVWYFYDLKSFSIIIERSED